jgi:MFS family permease
MPLTILFFTIHVGMRATTVGLAMTVGGAIAMVLAPVGGHLIDELTPKRALMLAWVGSALSAASWLLVHNFWELALSQAALNVFTGIGWNASLALLVDLSDEGDISKVMATSYSLRNFGFGAGGLLSVLALAAGSIGFELAVYANTATFVLGAALTVGLVAPPRKPKDPDAEAITIWTVLSDWRYVGLSFLNALIAFNQVGLSVVLPLWIVFHTHAPKEMIGLMYTLNTAMVVTCQLWVSRNVSEPSDTLPVYLRGALTMAAAAGFYLGAHYVGEGAAIALVIAGTVMLTWTEMLVSACSFVVSIAFAHDQHRGKYLSVFGMGWALEATLGPTVGTALVAAGILFPWPAIAAIVAAGTFGSRAVVRRSTRAVIGA